MTGPGERDRDSRTNKLDVVKASSFLGHGMTFALSTLLFLLAGNWADEKLGTGPVLAIVGTLVGATAGFYSLYRHVTEANRDDGGSEGSR